MQSRKIQDQEALQSFSLKYALDDRRGGKIYERMTASGEQILLAIGDNGVVGIPEDVDFRKTPISGLAADV